MPHNRHNFIPFLRKIESLTHFENSLKIPQKKIYFFEKDYLKRKISLNMRFTITVIFLLACGFLKAQENHIYPSGTASSEADSLYHVAIYAMLNGENKSFFRHIEKVIELDSTCFKCYAHAALFTHRLTGGIAPFDTLAKTALSIDSKDWTDEAYATILTSKLISPDTEITESFAQFVSNNPKIEGYIILGNYFLKSGDVEAAHLNFYRAFRLDENFTPSYRLLSETSQKLGYTEVADYMMESYVAKTPGQARTCDVYGDYLMKKGYHKAASEQFRMAYQLDNNYQLSLEKADKLSAAFAEKESGSKE